MTKQAEIIKQLEAISAKGAKTVIPVVVTSVDETTMTCDAIYEDIELFNIRLKATENDNDYVVIIPVVGSSILVGIIGTSDNTYYMVKASEPEKVRGKIGETNFVISTAGLVINNGDLGGLLISQAVIDEINEVKDDLNNLKSVFNSWVTVPSDGGAALKAAAATWAGESLPDADADVLINLKVKQ